MTPMSPTTCPAESPGTRPATRPATREATEFGATTAEYAVCTGAGVGIAGLLFKFLTSDAGQQIIRTIFDHVLKLLPF